jgi:hypothetical protein
LRHGRSAAGAASFLPFLWRARAVVARREAPMDAIRLTLLVMLVGSAAFLLWRRWRWRTTLETTRHTGRCPIHGDTAAIVVTTDPAARTREQYLGVTSCSLISDAATALPERVAYLWDGPPCKVRMEPARFVPIYALNVACRQPCIDVLNMTASEGAPQPVRCTSGASDALSLAEQADGRGRMTRLLWYASL